MENASPAILDRGPRAREAAHTRDDTFADTLVPLFPSRSPLAQVPGPDGEPYYVNYSRNQSSWRVPPGWAGSVNPSQL
jgi:hypothetical protein